MFSDQIGEPASRVSEEFNLLSKYWFSSKRKVSFEIFQLSKIFSGRYLQIGPHCFEHPNQRPSQPESHNQRSPAHQHIQFDPSSGNVFETSERSHSRWDYRRTCSDKTALSLRMWRKAGRFDSRSVEHKWSEDSSDHSAGGWLGGIKSESGGVLCDRRAST